MAGDRTAGTGNGRILVMGIGNLLIGDEGVGVHAVRALSKTPLPDDVDLLDVGTAFIDAIVHVDDRRHIIILDAVKGGGRPGTVYRIEVKPDDYARESTSLHGMSILNMLRFARVDLPETVTIFGIEPEVIDWSMDLSDTVAAAKPLLVEAVLSEIGRIIETIDVQTA